MEEKDLKEAADNLKEIIKNNNGIVCVGYGECLYVYVKNKKSSKNIPKEVNGIEVKVIISGDIVAL